MALATSLSKDEVQKSLKAVMKMKSKNVPPPKYLCMPSSHQIQQKVISLDSTQSVCDTLHKLIIAHGSIPELRALTVKTMKTIYTSQHGTETSLKLSVMRRFVERRLKAKFLEHPDHRQFWSFILIGVNRVIKHLEKVQTSSPEEAAKQTDPSLCCILLDAGWLASQLGHHMAHLCAARDVRLISFRPTQSLAKLISTDLYRIKKAIAIGICLSITAPKELVSWVWQVCSIVPRLVLPRLLASSSATAPKRTAQEARLDDDGDRGTSKAPSSIVPTSWNQYKIDREKLYLYGTIQSSMPPERVISLSELWSRLSATLSAQRTQSPIGESAWSAELEPQLMQYEQAVLRTVTPQTEAQRKSKKLGKKKKKKKGPAPENSTSESMTTTKKKKRKKMKTDNS